MGEGETWVLCLLSRRPNTLSFGEDWKVGAPNKRKEFIADVNSRFSCMGFCTHERSVLSPEDMTGTAT